jgi:hypothetical protein
VNCPPNTWLATTGETRLSTMAPTATSAQVTVTNLGRIDFLVEGDAWFIEIALQLD